MKIILVDRNKEIKAEVEILDIKMKLKNIKSAMDKERKKGKKEFKLKI